MYEIVEGQNKSCLNSVFNINMVLCYGSCGSTFVKMFTCFFFLRFQYSGDSDDKLWLYEQNELPITGGKVQ